MNLVTLLWTGVAAFRRVGDKNLCRCFGAPACRVFPDHMHLPALALTAPAAPKGRVRWSPPRFGQARRASETRSAAISPAAPVPCGPKGNDPMIESLVIIGLFLVPLATTRSKDGRSCT